MPLSSIKNVDTLIESGIHECVDECDKLTQKNYSEFMKLINRLNLKLQLELEEIFVLNSGLIAEFAYHKGIMDCVNMIRDSNISA